MSKAAVVVQTQTVTPSYLVRAEAKALLVEELLLLLFKI